MVDRIEWTTIEAVCGVRWQNQVVAFLVLGFGFVWEHVGLFIQKSHRE